MLKSKKASYIILGALILSCAGIIFFVFDSLDSISFVASPNVFSANLSGVREKKVFEVEDGILVIKELDKETIKNRIEEGKKFLYRMENQELHGFYKYYDALADSLEPQLHTVYSASIIYTFLYVYDYDKDEEILTRLDDWAGFLLSMQETDKDNSRYGAFSYSYDMNSKEREKRYVVGTSALSIFTLLRLHEITGEQKYLDSAKIAGDWIVSMQRQDGVIKPYVRHNGEEWVYGNQFSLLYNGQCLSALSKLYHATGEEKYYLAAEKTADLFASEYEKAGRGYVVDEYRTKNPISNTWIVMSLMDFYKTKKQDYYKDIVFELSGQIISNQFNDQDDLFNYGRVDGAYSTSGNGWISEVMTDAYSLCAEEGRQDCDKYRQAVLNIIRWIIARTYSEENSGSLPNPERASGGIFWNKSGKYVRTDSVCHGLNGYTRIMEYLDDGILLSI